MKVTIRKEGCFCCFKRLKLSAAFNASVLHQDAKINSMERSLRDMEEELLMMKSNGLLSCEERQEEMKQMEVYRSHTKFMKNKVR